MADRRVVVGVFRTEDEAVRAINDLLSMGYTRDEISVLAEDPDRFRRLDDQAGVTTESPDDVGKGAAAGAVTGGVLGGLGALVAELGILAIPGVGPFLAAGPIAATIGGLVAGGAVGGAIGALVGLGVDKEEARVYEQNLKDGDILVIVEADDDRYDRVNTTLRHSDYGRPGYDRDRDILDRDRDPSLHDRMDRDNDGRLDTDDLRRDRRDTDLGVDRDRDILDRDRDGRSLHDRMDRDNDGRLDTDDLRRDRRDTDPKI